MSYVVKTRGFGGLTAIGDYWLDINVFPKAVFAIA